jgi:hypothetical protein
MEPPRQRIEVEGALVEGKVKGIRVNAVFANRRKPNRWILVRRKLTCKECYFKGSAELTTKMKII